MDFSQMGAVPVLLLFLQMHHAVSSAAVPDQMHEDTWLTGYEPNVIDGLPAEPSCKIVSVTENPATPAPAPKTTPQPVTVKGAQRPNPNAAPSVSSGLQPPVVPLKPHNGFILVPFFLANGGAAVYAYDAGGRLVRGMGPVSPNVPLLGNGFPPVLVPPGNGNLRAGRGFPNYGVIPANPLGPSRTRTASSLSLASRWATFLRSGNRVPAARAHAFMSSESSEEYRG
ncbi:hypothetical protein AAFF_G00349670 [Aldrovandia affinis]|uniref:Uncharacterized protein n=1 Tax=Aldrovandia affinis TaxID=143900 RepID=A0AAD7SLH8_9TELE|nr:hypothetical protein AAFF_G00349670 [Aldrovandia affinis]